MELLNRVRVGIMNENDIALLKTRLVSDNSNFSLIFHIFPTCKQVEHHNANVQKTLTTEEFVVKAEHFFSQNDLTPNLQVDDDDLILDDDRDAGGLLSTLTLSVGIRVMLVRNLCVKFGLVNGARGYIHAIHTIPFTDAIVKSVDVKFNDSGKLPKSVCNFNGSVSIEMYSQEFYNDGRYIMRKTFPLVPCWAATVHKVQGLTLNEAVLCLDDTLFQNGQAYVALSRVNSLQGVLLTGLCISKIKPDQLVLKEYLNMLEKFNMLK